MLMRRLLLADSEALVDADSEALDADSEALFDAG